MNKLTNIQNRIFLVLSLILAASIVYFLVLIFNKKNNVKEEFSTETTSPSTTSPSTTSPSTTSPQTTSPQTTSPSTTSPQTTSPQTTSPQQQSSPLTCMIGFEKDMKHVVSFVSGATYNIESDGTNNFFTIYQKPFKTGEHTHALSVTNNELFTAPKNLNSNKQKWYMQTNENNTYYLIPKAEQNKTTTKQVLQYDNGFLTLRPMSTYEGQKWKVEEGIASAGVKSCAMTNKEMLAGMGLDGLGKVENPELHAEYKQQLGNILNIIHSNLIHYQNKIGANKTTASSVFGTGEPLKLTVNVDGLASSATEEFKDAKNNSVLDLLDKYEANELSGGLQYAPLNQQSELQKKLSTMPKCKKVNFNDYVNNRIGECNCDLSDM